MKTNIKKEILDTMSRNPSNWKGIFYFNRRDPRIIVPKLNPSLGWTLNFASPYSYLFLVSLALIIFVTSNYIL
jgi:uncharacterized membrane protein